MTKTISPLFLRLFYKTKNAYLRTKNRGKSTKAIFTKIYRNNEWGGKAGQFYSGAGSDENHALLYANTVKQFIDKQGITKVVDLGCGDFRVGQRLLMPGMTYIGVDIVDELIQHHRNTCSIDNVSFQCLDMITDELPDGELCLIRQVLQHLSNDQIATILKKTKKYRYILVTEHYPSPSVTPVLNKDKPHGRDTRTYDNSAVYLEAEPFNIQGLQMILDDHIEAYLLNPGERIKTFLIQN
ncbi:MAG TPA: class I SAM-dependent methyltransferase [Microcoleaceae cyanobacterium]